MSQTVPEDIARATLDPKAYAADRPMHEAFRWLRANAPLAKIELDGSLSRSGW